ncbi:MAG: hypothetical protein V7765_07105 [Oleispira sp.]
MVTEKFMKLLQCFVLLLLAVSQSVLAASTETDSIWTLEKEQDGIKIYTGKVDGASLITYKAVTEINTNLGQLFDFFQDNKVTTQWIYNLKSIKLLEQKEFYESNYYVVYSTPWPVSDVSAVLRATWKYDAVNEIIMNSTVSVNAEEYSDDGFMHIPLIETHNEFQQVGTGKVKLSFQVVIDHGYALPDVIVDAVSIETLYSTLVSLKKFNYEQYNKTNLFKLIPAGHVKAKIETPSK